MTAGGGIAHSEQSPDPHSPMLHGAQLWVALPDAERERAPSFDHHRELPVLREPGATATVLLGELAGARSPGQVHTALVGVDVTLVSGADAVLPLEGDFEHAVLTVSGRAGGRRRGAAGRGRCATSAPAGRRCGCAPRPRAGCCCSAGSRSPRRS